MGAAAHAGIISADDFFAFEFHLRFFHVHVLIDELDKVELDCDLVLTRGDDDFTALNDAFVVYFEFVIERATWRFDQSDADTRFGCKFLWWFWMEGFLFQEINRFIHGVEDFDRLGEVVVEDIVGRENLERIFGVVFGPWVEAGAIDIEARDRTYAIGFALEGVGGGLGVGKDDVFEVVAIARFIHDEALHIPEVAFEVGKFGIPEGGVVALSEKS